MNITEFERKVVRVIAELAQRLGHRPRLLMAVSGGADSVAMLRVITSVRGRAVCDAVAVNCNFNLRGEESDRDSRMVAELCRRLEVPLHNLSFDTRAYIAGHPGLSVEMACRELRYRAFRRICLEEGVDRVAVAHNSDDNAETLLLNLMRGSGTRGLRGMRVDTQHGPEGCAVFRPMLSVSREEIEAYLNLIRQTFITDSSNLDSGYRRNFLRLEVLPLLETRWPGVKNSLAATAAILGEEGDLVEDTLEKLCPAGCRHLPADSVTQCVAPVTLALHFIAPYGGTPSQAAEMVRLPRRTGAMWRLAGGAVVEARPEEWVITEPVTSSRSLAGEEPYAGKAEDTDLGPCRADDDRWIWEEVEMTPDEWTRLKNTPACEGVYLPEGPEAYCWRRVTRGDRMKPLGLKGSKAVSDLLKEAGIPVSLRPQTRVLVSKRTGEIIWLEGIRRSAAESLKPGADRAWRLRPA